MFSKFYHSKALGDPTVRKFVSRDLDAWILPREREAVREWENSGLVSEEIEY